MRTGLMRRKVTIRTMARTSDGMGGYTETPTDVTGIPARIDPLEGTEQINAMQTGMQRPHRIVMRYRDGVTGAKTLLYGTRTFDIKSVVDPEERHRELHILADEVNAFTVTEVQTPSDLWRRNEPAGMTTIHDRPFSVLNNGSPYNQDSGTPWRDFPDRGFGAGMMDIVSDATAPKSPPSVGRIIFPVTTPIGDVCANSFTWDDQVGPGWHYKHFYVCAAWKCSANWWGCNTGANKIFYCYTQNVGGGQIINLSAVGNGVAQIGIIIQAAVAGNGVYTPTPGTGIITRGQSHQIEVYWVGNDNATANGTCTVWLDGVLVLTITGIQTDALAALFNNFGWNPIWSGGDAVPAQQYQYLDHVYLSGKVA